MLPPSLASTSSDRVISRTWLSSSFVVFLYMAYSFDSFLPFWEYGYSKDTPPSLFLQSTTFDYISGLSFSVVPRLSVGRPISPQSTQRPLRT